LLPPDVGGRPHIHTTGIIIRIHALYVHVAGFLSKINFKEKLCSFIINIRYSPQNFMYLIISFLLLPAGTIAAYQGKTHQDI